MEYENGKQVLESLFAGNASLASRQTPFSRQTWQAWKSRPTLPAKLELWLLKRDLPSVPCSEGPSASQ